METTKRKHDNVESDDGETASLWYFNPTSLKSQSIDISKKEFLIGRCKEVDFQVTAQRVSRTHCLIRTVGTRNAPKWELVDKNSTLGTFLNGRKVPANQPAPLKDGDVIYLTDPDVYPIRFVTNKCKPAKISKPAPLVDDSDVIIIKDSCDKSVIELDSSITSIGLLEDTTAKSCANIINNSVVRSDKVKMTSNNNVADKENSNEEFKLKVSLLHQKLQDQEKEMERLKSELKNKEDEMERMSKDKEILKYIEENNNELIRNLTAELYARKRELESYQQSNSEEAVLLKTSKSFVELIESELQCSICNEVIVTASISIPCFHIFCNACIGMWFRQKKECAVCRTPSHMRVPCKILDSFIEKLMEMVPDREYRLKRQQICEERRIQNQNAVNPPPVAPGPTVDGGDEMHFAFATQFIMEMMENHGRRAQETVTIDLTVADIAAANAAAAAAQAAAAQAASAFRSRGRLRQTRPRVNRR